MTKWPKRPLRQPGSSSLISCLLPLFYLPPMNASDQAKPRQSRRSPVYLRAKLEIEGDAVAVKLRNLSEHGALLEGANFPPEGAITFFESNDLRVKAQVVWVHGSFAGLVFGRRLSRKALLRNVPTPRQRIEPCIRRPGLGCQPLTDSERRLLELWATSAAVSRPGE